MKNSKKFFCGIAIFSLAVGAGVFALSQGQSGFRRAEAAVTDVEPISELHLDQTKIKNVSIQYETMAGHSGNTVAAYVASASGLETGKNAEYRFVTEGTEGNTKIAYSKAVEQVHFWYKLTNSSERNVADGDFPYLLQVLDSKGTYPLRDWTPVVDGAWHEQTMDVGSDFYNQFAGFVVKSGDLNGSITIAEIQLRTSVEAVSELHLDTTKVKHVTAHYEWMAGHNGAKVAAYMIEGSGNLYYDETFPEVRFLTIGSEGSTKIPYASKVVNAHFWYKMENSMEQSCEVTEPYCIQVVTESAYPKYEFTPIKDGQWHPWTVQVRESEQEHFVGVLIEFGDLNGYLAVSDFELNKTVTEIEPASDLHLDQTKIKHVSAHYEYMAGPDGSLTNTYVIEGEGNLYYDETYPEVRFLNDGSNGSTKHAYDFNVTNVHFWYKLENTMEQPCEVADPYCLQVVTETAYPKYEFKPIKDGQWHEWLLEVRSEDQANFVGVLVEFGDLCGEFTITNLELNGAYKNLESVISFGNKDIGFNYIGDMFVDFALTERIFTSTSYYDNGKYENYQDKDGNELQLRDGIIINGKTLRYWQEFEGVDETYPRNDGIHSFPTSAGGQYNPVALELLETTMAFKLNIEFFPTTDTEITFKAGLFAGYYNGVSYILNKDLTYKSTLPTEAEIPTVLDTEHANVTLDSAAKHNRIKFVKVDELNETEKLFTIDHVDRWGDTVTTGDYSYRWYVLWSNVPRPQDMTRQSWTIDNFRYMNEDILMNGVPLYHYILSARGNSRDFTSLNPLTQNPAYEALHPTGSLAANYDTAIQLSLVTDQDNYVFFIYIPEQLFVDYEIAGNPTFSIREGALWQLRDGEGNSYKARNTLSQADKDALADLVNNGLHMSDYNENNGYCKDNEHGYYAIAKAKFIALSADAKYTFLHDDAYGDARARISAWAVANNEVFNMSTGDFSRITTLNPLFTSMSQDHTTLIIVVASVGAMLAVGGFFIIKKKRG